jgi:hypothetical protein
MFLNILHRPTPVHYPFFEMQQNWAHELGLKVSVMATYPSLQDKDIVAGLRRYAEQYGDELGIYVTELQCPAFAEKLGVEMDAVWLYGADEKRRILELVFDQFRECFGRGPVSVAGYHLDAISLAIIRELCPSIRIAVAGCFEEGVRVFHGCNNSWYLFNEGMPWNPWYPSRDNALRPAVSDEEALGIVAVPHLSRDMVLSYEGRNDFWASHPGNAMRGLGYRDSQCPYNLNLVDQYLAQEKHNDGFSYYNVFVGPGWLTHNMNIDDPPEVAQKLHREQYEYFAQLREQGRLTDMTLSEFGAWFRQHRHPGQPEAYLASDILYGSRKQYVWYLDADMRVLVDLAQGGSIGDLRPYIARLAGFTGSDSSTLQIGSYPYLIHSQHRTGVANHAFDGARTTLEVTHAGETLDLCACRTRAAQFERDHSGYHLHLTPARLCFADGLEAAIETSYVFLSGGRVHITRKLAQVSRPQARLSIREYVKACYGWTEYPEDMRGIVLTVSGENIESLTYDYRSRRIRTAGAAAVSAVVPQISTELRLASLDGPADLGEAREGHLFSPFYTLALEKTLTVGESMQTCLSVSKAP